MLKQRYEPDFLCHDKIIVVIKAVKRLTDEHRAQVINYLKTTGKSWALLVNFGHYPKIEHERLLCEKIDIPTQCITISNTHEYWRGT